MRGERPAGKHDPVRGTPDEAASGPPRSEEGSGTILVAGICALALGCALVLGVSSALSAGRARLDAVADLAALAGADVSATAIWEEVGERPCARAREVARRNGVALESCEVIGADARVVLVDRIAVLGIPVTVKARARAGPP